MSHDDEIEDHDRGLSHDLPVIANRRRMLSILGGAGLAATLAACGLSDTADTSNADPQGGGSGGDPPQGGSTAAVGEGEIPEETAGPYPGDGSGDVNVLTESGVVRSDIRSSFGGASGTAEGVPLTISLTVVDVSSADDAGTAVSGAAVYVWHCDSAGDYSLYSEPIVAENYLRGVQETDQDGVVTFTSIFPACYAGRWPHVHFEVYPSIDDATGARNRLRTSQMALPEDASRDVYANAEGYQDSVTNLSRMTLDSDNVFSDGYSLQLGKVTGSIDAGYAATLRVPI